MGDPGITKDVQGCNCCLLKKKQTKPIFFIMQGFFILTYEHTAVQRSLKGCIF